MWCCKPKHLLIVSENLDLVEAATRCSFYKNSCSSKFRKIHKKIPVPHFLLKNTSNTSGSTFRPATLWKKPPTQVFSSENCEIFKNTILKNICERLSEKSILCHAFLYLLCQLSSVMVKISLYVYHMYTRQSKSKSIVNILIISTYCLILL